MKRRLFFLSLISIISMGSIQFAASNREQAGTASAQESSHFVYLPAVHVDLPLEIELTPYVLLTYDDTNFKPVAIKHAGDEKMYVASQRGRIYVVENWIQRDVPFLDISEFVDDVGDGGEKGLLGLAFHPEYESNGYFYVSYTTHPDGPDHDSISIIERYSVLEDNPYRADINSRVTILTVKQPTASHNGGDIHFGPDGYLYIGFGDGTRTDYPDPQNFAQDGQKFLGKMLRIDVNQVSPHQPDCDLDGQYTIPRTNPFISDDEVCNEIWSIGLRNPWRFSFDRLTGDLFIGDVGYHWAEEINWEPAGHPGGNNYGWRCYEGWFRRFTDEECGFSGSARDYTQPVVTIESTLNQGNSITGGYVYRGDEYEEMQGIYFYADFATGEIYALIRAEGGWFQSQKMLRVKGLYPSTFGESHDGKLYIADYLSDMIYEVVPDRTR